MPTPPELLLLDGTAMLFRAYFSKHKHQAPDGLEVGGAVLVAQRLQRILSRQQPDRVALLFDAGHRTFRHALTTDYKGQRPRPPDDLRPQFDLVRAIGLQLGLACFCVRGFEADDLMATLSSHGRRLGYRCRMYSSDKDLFQLIADADEDGPAITQEIPRSRERLDADAVYRRIGVRTDQVIDYMSLVGDACDNIPGIRGVGPKTAEALLTHFGTLDHLYDNLDAVPTLSIRGAAAVRLRLEDGREDAMLARKLVTLRHDVEVGISPETILQVTRWTGTRDASADALFERLGFPEPLMRLRYHAHRLFRQRPRRDTRQRTHEHRRTASA